MLTYKKSTDEKYTLLDGDQEIAWVEVKDNLIESVTYADEKVNMRYGDFTLRSAVFVLRNKHLKVKCAFYDARLERIGFVKTESGMEADSLKINFDTCCC